jgi:hypothetical protein
MSEPSKPPHCPICRKPVASGKAGRFAPFCSQRCADLDLGRWLKGSYVVPGSPEEAETPDQDQAPEKE